jgi:hypothetical protein
MRKAAKAQSPEGLKTCKVNRTEAHRIPVEALSIFFMHFIAGIGISMG